MTLKDQPAPYIRGLSRDPDVKLRHNEYPGNLKFVRDLEFSFDSAVTFFVGENGSGKSTLLEAIAVQARMPISGGSMNELAERYAFAEKSLLADALWLSFIRKPKDRYFFRAETQAHFASLLEARKQDPEFYGDPYVHFGGQSLHTRSHGEAFLAILKNRFKQGLFLMDEPESALSPQRQLTLLAQMYRMVMGGKSQFIIATHSPILLTYPGAQILSFDDDCIEDIDLEDCEHYQLTRALLNNPKQYWRMLTTDDD